MQKAGETMDREVSFIHAADLHLDSPFKGLRHVPEPIFKEIRESTFTALKALVKQAIDLRVDFVLMAGDNFDNAKQSLKAQIRLRRAFEALRTYDIMVYISYGNHDYINGNTHPVTYPDNVFIFPTEEVTSFVHRKNGEKLARIYGFSYEMRSVKQKKAAEYKIEDPSIPYHIAMLHGSIQSNTDHDVYAPFQLSDLQKEDFSYWALGHIHKREILNEHPPIVYPGNIQGRSRREMGEKGCYHVVLSGTQSEVNFLPLAAIQFSEMTVDVTTCERVHELEQKIQDALHDHSAAVPQLIDLKLISDNQVLDEWKKEDLIQDIIDLVNEASIHKKDWQFIFQADIEVRKSLSDEILYQGDHFIGELMRVSDNEGIQDYIGELYQQKQARKYVDALSPEEEKEIKQAAKELLINELLKEEPG